MTHSTGFMLPHTAGSGVAARAALSVVAQGRPKITSQTTAGSGGGSQQIEIDSSVLRTHSIGGSWLGWHGETTASALLALDGAVGLIFAVAIGTSFAFAFSGAQTRRTGDGADDQR